MAAAYNAPVGGALFAMEVILGNFALEIFGPIVVSSVISTVIARSFRGPAPIYATPDYALVSGSQSTTNVKIPGFTGKELTSSVLNIGPGFFTTMQTPVLLGREIVFEGHSVSDIERCGPERLIERGDGRATPRQLPNVRLCKARHYAQQGCLATAVGAGHDQRLSAIQCKFDVREQRDATALCGEPFSSQHWWRYTRNTNL